jgi:hypothetical protein
MWLAEKRFNKIPLPVKQGRTRWDEPSHYSRKHPDFGFGRVFARVLRGAIFGPGKTFLSTVKFPFVTMRNPIDRAIRAVSVLAGIVSVIVILVLQVL